MRALVLTAVGPDRPGLVEALAEAVAGHGGNWLESRMARMAGQFAGIVHVQVDAEQLEPLSAALSGLEARGLKVSVTPAEPETPSAVRRLEMSLVGQDRQGIVRDISAALSRNGVNVEELETEYTRGAMSGEALFNASALLTVPTDLSLDHLRKELERVADDLMVDLEVSESSEP